MKTNENVQFVKTCRLVRSESGSKRTPETGQHGGGSRTGRRCCLPGLFQESKCSSFKFLSAVKDEATHLRKRVQERLKRRGKLPLTYIAAFEALGWELD